MKPPVKKNSTKNLAERSEKALDFDQARFKTMRLSEFGKPGANKL